MKKLNIFLYIIYVLLITTIIYNLVYKDNVEKLELSYKANMIKTTSFINMIINYNQQENIVELYDYLISGETDSFYSLTEKSNKIKILLIKIKEIKYNISEIYIYSLDYHSNIIIISDSTNKAQFNKLLLKKDIPRIIYKALGVPYEISDDFIYDHNNKQVLLNTYSPVFNKQGNQIATIYLKLNDKEIYSKIKEYKMLLLSFSFSLALSSCLIAIFIIHLFENRNSRINNIKKKIKKELKQLQN
jgi:hypothetical protein